MRKQVEESTAAESARRAMERIMAGEGATIS